MMASRTNDSPEPRKRLIDVITEFHQMEWGFTGTRKGMTFFQRDMVNRVLKIGQPGMFRHGGAYGADSEAHASWRAQQRKAGGAEVWPADTRRAALFMNQKRVEVMPIMDPLVRNIEVIKRSQFMVAAPHTEAEILRSGTWQTIRESFKANLPVFIIWPHTKRITFYSEKKLYRVTYTTA